MDLYDNSTPLGDNIAQRNFRQPAFNHDLFSEVISNHNMARAWKQVKANKGAAGVDGVEIDQFQQWARKHLPQCKQALIDGTYRPLPVRRVEIDKPNGGKRQLGIACVCDRVIQQAIAQVISPIIDPTFFSEYSYGFRPNRNAQQAVLQVHRYIKLRYLR